ncbi:MAG: hypothetical protein M3340_04975 [Actinomycetota bacterium]|nr:hypothetical protein [Actinomycetota bacterium]
MNAPLIVAGLLALLTAAIHGTAGEVLLFRRLQPSVLPSSRFGDSAMTKTLIRITWHIVTVTFLTFGVALLLSGSVLDGDAARAVGVVVAASYTAFWAVGIGIAAASTRSARFALVHPAPLLFSLILALAWWGAL